MLSTRHSHGNAEFKNAENLDLTVIQTFALDEAAVGVMHGNNLNLQLSGHAHLTLWSTPWGRPSTLLGVGHLCSEIWSYAISAHFKLLKGAVWNLEIKSSGKDQ